MSEMPPRDTRAEETPRCALVGLPRVPLAGGAGAAASGAGSAAGRVRRQRVSDSEFPVLEGASRLSAASAALITITEDRAPAAPVVCIIMGSSFQA
jgi:hypothetical protein